MGEPNKQRPLRTKLLRRLLAAPFVFVAAVIILLEDWLWDDLSVVGAKVAGTALVARLFTCYPNLC